MKVLSYLGGNTFLKKKNSLFVYFNVIPLKIMKNRLLFILEAIFVLKLLKCLSRLFAHAEKPA